MRGQGSGKRSKVVGRLRGFARGGEDRAVVVPQQVEPMFDVAGVPQFARDSEVGAEEGGGKLGDQFLGGVGARAEASGEVTVEAGFVSRPMTELVERRRIIWFDRCERAHRRQVDEVERRDEARLIAPVADVGLGRRNERVDRRVPLGLGRKRRFRDGEVLNLRDIEDRVLAQHRSLLDLVVFALEDDRFGEHDMRAVFALSHMRPLIERLLEGHPRVRRIWAQASAVSAVISKNWRKPAFWRYASAG